MAAPKKSKKVAPPKKSGPPAPAQDTSMGACMKKSGKARALCLKQMKGKKMPPKGMPPGKMPPMPMGDM